MTPSGGDLRGPAQIGTVTPDPWADQRAALTIAHLIDDREERRLILETLGLATAPETPAEPKADSEDIRLALHAQGLNDRQLGDAVGRDQATIKYWRSKRDLKANAIQGCAE